MVNIARKPTWCDEDDNRLNCKLTIGLWFESFAMCTSYNLSGVRWTFCQCQWAGAGIWYKKKCQRVDTELVMTIIVKLYKFYLHLFPRAVAKESNLVKCVKMAKSIFIFRPFYSLYSELIWNRLASICMILYLTFEKLFEQFVV